MKGQPVDRQVARLRLARTRESGRIGHYGAIVTCDIEGLHQLVAGQLVAIHHIGSEGLVSARNRASSRR